MRILKSFKFMIPAITVVFVLIINILNAAIVITTVKNHAMSEALEKNTIISEAISNKISLYMHNAVKIVLASTKEINKHPRDFGKLVGEIDRLYVNYAQFDLVFFHDKNGKLLYSNPINPQATQDYTYTDRDYFQQVIQKGDVYISRLYISRVLKVPHFVVAAPILDENNKVLGVLGAGISLVNVYNVARDSKKPFQGGIRIIDSAGALMVDPDRNLNNEVVLADDFKININDETTTLYELLGRQKEGIGIIIRNGQTYYDAITYVSDLGWMIMLEQSEETVLEKVYTLADRLRSIIFGTLVISLLIGLLLVRHITVPIKKLVSSVQKLGQGKFDNNNFADEYQNEIGDLYKAFKEMAGKLDDKILQLEKSLLRENELQRSLNNIIMSASNGIMVVKNDIIIIYNNALENITGYSKKLFLGISVEKFYQTLQIDLAGTIDDVVESGKNISGDFEQKICRSNGKRIRCLINISTVRDAEGSYDGFVFFFKNVENERVMEERLKREDRINALGKFTSSIIHEIGNPLAGLANLLEVHEEADEKQKTEIIELVHKEIKDLNEIVINYLHFAGQNSPIYAVSNLKQIICEILNILQMEIKTKNITLKFDCLIPNPFVRIDRRGIKQAFINILSNSVQAVKANGLITIEIYKENDRVLIAFTDNGEGIIDEDKEKIFDLFYSTKESGNGLGLSIADKIIRDHSGSISVRSQIGHGSSFIVSLPA